MGIKDLVRKNVLTVKNYVPGKPIEEVQRELGLKDVIKLASNENCFGPSPKAMKAIGKSLELVNRYPDSSGFYLRKRMARHLGVKEDRLIFGNGSDELIGLAVRTFVNEGDEVVIARPTFLIYEIVSSLQSARIVPVPMASLLKYDLEAMKDAVTPRTKMVFIANPDNPTGSYVTRLELDRFFKGLPDSAIVFLDEAYAEFAASSFKDYPDGLKYLSRPGVIVARSFSKAYGLAGLRVGYAVSDAETIGYMDRAREPFNVNLLAQTGAMAALDDKNFLNRTLKHVKQEKSRLYAFFNKMGLDYVESATNFILVDTRCDGAAIFKALLKEGVIVRDMKAWRLDTYIRITIGTRWENQRFMTALCKVLKTITKSGVCL